VGREGTGGSQYRWSYLVEVPFAEQSSWGAVLQLGVQALEPKLDDIRAVSVSYEARSLVGEAEPLLVNGILDAALTIGPLAYGTSLFDSADVSDKLGAEKVTKLLDQDRSAQACGLGVGSQARSLRLVSVPGQELPVLSAELSRSPPAYVREANEIVSRMSRDNCPVCPATSHWRRGWDLNPR
jgi:hypothetical protein